MGKTGTQLSAQTTDLREYRRFRAWELRQEGWTQQRIASALGVTQGAVSQGSNEPEKVAVRKPYVVAKHQVHSVV